MRARHILPVRRGRRGDLKTLLGRIAFEFDPADIRKKDRERSRTTSERLKLISRYEP